MAYLLEEYSKKQIRQRFALENKYSKMHIKAKTEKTILKIACSTPRKAVMSCYKYTLIIPVKTSLISHVDTKP